jgi:hypothetical protein
MNPPTFDRLVCGECESENAVHRVDRVRGPGAFLCEVCGQDIFLWTCEQSQDYYFRLVRDGSITEQQ